MNDLLQFVETLLLSVPNIGKCQKAFICHIIWLNTALRGRFNFLNMARYGSYSERSYRANFEKEFDFAALNTVVIRTYCSTRLSWIFDPSYIAKSGKKTPGTGYFWSGCAGKVKWGLEFGGLGIADHDNHTAMHYHGTLTPKMEEDDTLLKYYSRSFVKDEATIETLQKLSTQVAVDAFFSKITFVEPLCKAGYTITSRLRTDSHLRYAYTGAHSVDKRGPKKKYDGKIDIRNVSEDHFTNVAETTDKDGKTERIFTGKAHVRGLKRWCKILIVQYLKEGKITAVFIYFCTDCAQEWATILERYRHRFQIEFLYRDAKQFLGLEQCQSRQAEALDFHLNLTLSTLNMLKAKHWFPLPKNEAGKRPPFSAADLKTLYINDLILNKLILIYGKDPKVEINNPQIAQLFKLGTIAA
jgi:hypothetical protein